ncbi:MAG: beta-galactosidase [Asticcacaulis sp.]
MKLTTALVGLGLLSALPATAETLSLTVPEAAPAVREGLLKMGANRSPDGHVITANDRYLTLDGKPWFPVMGEFHYSRFPRAYWEEQLLKMKAGGVTVVSTYVIWRHHQPEAGAIDFTGDNDLRHFVELAHKHGLYVFLRPGPWVHAEVRFGGLPDWVVDSSYTRSNDPAYIAHVDGFFSALSEQTKGLMWKDGGPVIGIQIENEYNRAGPLQGREHIAALKALLIEKGYDVPLYTVTGWDNAVWPRGEAIPVFGTYVDEPWAARSDKLPPKSSYLFQFGIRNEKGLGAQGSTSQQDDGARDTDITPFFGAEYGGGVPPMYRRRPVLAVSDIPSMVVTKLGSGVNLLGYYMYHGGQNPWGRPTHEESVASGGFNDTPQLGYDFQAPLGQYGLPNHSYVRLKPIHSFLNSFGDRLAPMTVHAPDVTPKDAADFGPLRWALRSDGHSGFLFVNNHVRQYYSETKVRENTRFTLNLPSGSLTLPSEGVRVGLQTSFIWPVNFDLSGINLVWATIQPVTQITDDEGDLYVFQPTSLAPIELAFDAAQVRAVSAGKRRTDGKHLIVSGLSPDAHNLLRITGTDGRVSRVLILHKDTNVTKLPYQGRERLIISGGHVFSAANGGLEVSHIQDDRLSVGFYPPLAAAPKANMKLALSDRPNLFQHWVVSVPRPEIRQAEVTAIRPAGKVPPLKMTGPAGSAILPTPEVFGQSATWEIHVPADAFDGAEDVFLEIDYDGDVARLFSGTQMLDDHYYDGRKWVIGLKRYRHLLDKPLTLSVLPFREDAKIFLEDHHRPKSYTDGQVARLNSTYFNREYRIRLEP